MEITDADLAIFLGKAAMRLRRVEKIERLYKKLRSLTPEEFESLYNRSRYPDESFEKLLEAMPIKKRCT